MVIKNDLGDNKPFFEILNVLYRQKTLLDSQKKMFLDLLRDNIETFKMFMSSQSSYFMKACSVYIGELSEEEIQVILDDDSYGFAYSYSMDPDKYIEKVQKSVEAYKNTQKYVQLTKHWFDITGTESPFKWSEQNGMPIFALVPPSESGIARKAFTAINTKSKDEQAIAIAEDYIGKMTYADKLSNKADCDRAFKDAILGDYAILFEDIDEVKKYLKIHVSESPCYWSGNPEVQAVIKKLANSYYLKSGYSRAKNVVDSMSSDQAKEYLKKMIEDNIVIGVEIIKGQK